MPSYEARVEAAVGDYWADKTLVKALVSLMEAAYREGYEQAEDDYRVLEEKRSLNDEFGD